MYQIRFTKIIKEKDIIDNLEAKYGTLDNLKKLHKDINGNKSSNTGFDLEEWNIYKDSFDGKVKETRVILTDEPLLGKIDLELLDSIKSNNPESIEDLAKLIDKDIRTLEKGLNFLVTNGFIELKESNNNKIPIFPYDYMQIVLGEVPFFHNSKLCCDNGEVYENAN